MNLPLVSICVPIYNVAPYIERCVRSIMEQTYPNLEYIFVNDGSTDRSLTVLENTLKDYPGRNRNVTIITNDRNRGTAYSRRVYTEKAKGEYITCVDSDDYVELDMVQCLVTKALETNADIVSAGYYYENGQITEIKEPYPCDGETDYIYLVLADLLNAVWGKLFHRTLFIAGRSCYAPEGLDYGEDRMMLFYIASKAKHIVTTKKPLYHYMQRSDSVSGGKGDKHFSCLAEFWDHVDLFLAERNLTSKYLHVTNKQKILDKTHMMHFCEDVAVCRKYANIFQQAENHIPALEDITRGKRLTHFLVKYHLWLILRLYKFFQNRSNHVYMSLN